MNYIVYDENGNILRTGYCPDDHLKFQAGPGEFVMPGEASDAQHMIRNGVVVDRPPQPVTAPEPEPAPTWIELRRAAYPPLADLADATYWQSQGDASKMQAYLAAVKAVKAKYPKPQ